MFAPLSNCALLLALVQAQDAVATSPGRPATKAERESHAAMVDALREIHARGPAENAYLGLYQLERFRALEERFPDDKLEAANLWDKAADVSRKIASFLLRQGDTEGCIAKLEKALALAEHVEGDARAPLEAAIRYDLAIAWMRLGETANCVARHTADSCLMPIRGEGVHADETGSRNAIEQFRAVTEMLDASDDYRAAAAWLWNVAAMTLGEWPDALPERVRLTPEQLASRKDFPVFRDVAPALGINSFDLSGGVVTEDFDGDGDFDVLFSTWATDGPLRFYRNEGDGTFVERSSEAGLDGIVGGLNMCQADYDGDGLIDVLVMRGAWLGAYGVMPNSLLRNCGDGTFVDVALGVGMTKYVPGQNAGWQDYDRDGDLDLFVGSETHEAHPLPSLLWRNEGNGTFVDVAVEAGVTNNRFAKGCSWGDFDEDGWPDLYVSNLGAPNRLYRNLGDGTFEDVAERAGVAKPIDSFPCWFWDFDNDGHLDLFVSGYHESAAETQIAELARSYRGEPFVAPLHHVYRGDGEGGFGEVGRALGLRTIGYPMGANFGDLDNDGFLDVYLGTGFPAFGGLMPNVLYHNERGKALEDVTFAARVGHLQKGHAVAFCDLDGDGDQDLVEQIGGAYESDGFGNALFENPGCDGGWIRIELIGTDSARCAIGAKLRIEITENGEQRSIHRVVNSGGSFGASSLIQHVGVGAATKVDALEVTWPRSGATQSFEGLPLGVRLRVTEGGDEAVVVSEPRFAFAD